MKILKVKRKCLIKTLIMIAQIVIGEKRLIEIKVKYYVVYFPVVMLDPLTNAI